MGLKPSYDQKNFSPDSWRNKLKLLASGDRVGEAVVLNTSAMLFRSRLHAGHAVVQKIGPGRHLFLYIIEGQAMIEGQGIDLSLAEMLLKLHASMRNFWYRTVYRLPE